MTSFEKIAEKFAPVTALLNEFIQMFDEEYTVQIGPNFCADNIKEVVYYSVAVPKVATDEFIENFVSRFPACSCFSNFTLSFMHELGHLETEWDMVDDTEERNTITDNKTYFELYNERIATDWAGEYLTEHRDEMLILEKQILRSLHEIWQSIPD